MNAKRLLKLANFLDTMPKEKFDFSVIANENGKPMFEALKAGNTRCGTVGCAVGWMPAVWPRSLEWTKDLFWSRIQVTLTRNNRKDFDAAAAWFGIKRADVKRLFAPGWRHEELSGLPETASPKRVANHIRWWVKARQAGK